jgi:hypothetical protein
LIKSAHIRFVFVLFLFALSCEKIPLVEADASNLTWVEEQAKIEEDGLRSEQRFRHPSMSEEQYQGAINAVKKAYQLTNITFTPLEPIAYNTGTYQPNNSYRGMIYSSVKELGTFVGNNISFHTFMTAIHNPRSRIYTERIDESPYNGANCRSYYGVVCSSLVSYALGLTPICTTYDFDSSEEMEQLDFSDLDGFHIADVLWTNGHVAMITDIVRDQKGSTARVQVTEAIQSGCRRRTVSRSVFQESILRSFKRAFRYKYLERNLNYTPVSEFVTVFDESPVSFEYNNDICTDKGDKSCYFVGEEVVLNLSSSKGTVEIYKDGVLLSLVDVDSEGIRLTDLDYGSYQARITDGDRNSAFTSWIMVDKRILSAAKERKVFFESVNATPLSISFCGKDGGRSIPASETICRRFTEEEITSGYMDISTSRKLSPYFMIVFSTEFGNISTTPIKWE